MGEEGCAGVGSSPFLPSGAEEGRVGVRADLGQPCAFYALELARSSMLASMRAISSIATRCLR